MKNIIYIIIGLVAGILVIVLSLNTKLFDPLENMIYDNMFAVKAKNYGTDINKEDEVISKKIDPNPYLNSNVLIIGIDEYSLETFGSWPFSYNIHAQFIEHLIEMKPAFVFLDLLFLESSARIIDIDVDYEEYEIHVIKEENRDIDDRFKAALIKAKEAGVKVFLGYPANTKVKGQEAIEGEEYLDIFKKNSYTISGSEKHMIQFKTAKPPLIEFGNAAWNIGTIAAEADPVDAIYRNVSLLGKYNNVTLSHMILELFLTYVEANPQNVTIIPGKIYI